MTIGVTRQWHCPARSVTTSDMRGLTFAYVAVCRDSIGSVIQPPKLYELQNTFRMVKHCNYK